MKMKLISIGSRCAFFQTNTIFPSGWLVVSREYSHIAQIKLGYQNLCISSPSLLIIMMSASLFLSQYSSPCLEGVVLWNAFPFWIPLLSLIGVYRGCAVPPFYVLEISTYIHTPKCRIYSALSYMIWNTGCYIQGLEKYAKSRGYNSSCNITRIENARALRCKHFQKLLLSPSFLV